MRSALARTAVLLTLLMPAAQWAQMPDWQRGIAKVTVHPDLNTKPGTAFVVSLAEDTAYLVTSAHVVASDRSPTVRFEAAPDQKPARVTVYKLNAEDREHGLAILKVDRPPAGVAVLQQASMPMIGTRVLVAGYPGPDYALTARDASISRLDSLDFFLSQKPDEGFSGGPVLSGSSVVGLYFGFTDTGKAMKASVVDLFVRENKIQWPKAREQPSPSYGREGAGTLPDLPNRPLLLSSDVAARQIDQFESRLAEESAATKRDYELGRQLGREQRFRDAAAIFRRAFDRVPIPEIAAALAAQLYFVSDNPGVLRAVEEGLRKVTPSTTLSAQAQLHYFAGMVRLNEGRYDAARTSLEAAIELVKAEPAERQSLATYQGNLATVEERAGNLDRAQSLYEQSLEILRSEGDHEFFAMDGASLGLLLLNKGDIAGAIQWLEQARTSAEKGCDPNTIQIAKPRGGPGTNGRCGNQKQLFAIIDTNLTLAYRLDRQTDKALETAKKAIEEARSAYGPNDLQVEIARHRLAQVYIAKDLLPLATHELEAIRNRMAAAPTRRVDLLPILDDLSLVTNLSGEADASNRYLRELFSLAETLGKEWRENPEVPRVPVFLHRVASEQLSRRNPAAAMRAAELALSINQSLVGGDHWHSGVDCSLIAILHVMMRNLTHALQYAERARGIFLAHFGVLHLRTAEANTMIGETSYKLGNHAKAKSHFAEALLANEHNFPGDDLQRATAMIHLARAELALGERDAAEPRLREALRITEKLKGTDDSEAEFVRKLLRQ